MSAVLEKMAQAIRAAALSKRPDTWPPSWEFFANEARAAIEALAANVTDEMYSAFYNHAHDAGDYLTQSEFKKRWGAALAAALRDGQKGGG